MRGMHTHFSFLGGLKAFYLLVRRCLMVAAIGSFFSISVISFAEASENYIGTIKEMTGNVTIARGAKKIAAEQGTEIEVDDEILTDSDGSAGILFLDETTLSLGPKSKVAIKDYIYNPDSSQFSFVVKIFKGTASYVSGLIAKLRPESAEFITPSATIGIRGTKFVIKVDNF